MNVQHEWIDVGTELGNNERYAMYQEPVDEMDVPRQPVDGRVKRLPRRSLGEFVARLNAAACALGISVIVCEDIRSRAQRRSDAARPRHAAEQWTNDRFN
jgi:hypothetical protein